MSAAWFLDVTEGTETGDVARAVDWAATPLGDPSTWPPALQDAVRLCFRTRFPVMIAWGEELRMIYNDGYREMLGTDKHPKAMGASVPVIWADVWKDIAPSFEQVTQRARATWINDQRLLMNRSGFDEETYFTYSYSPIQDADGVVQGLLDIASETTDQVVDRRRMLTLGRLSTALTSLPGGIDHLARTAVEVLSVSDDVVRAEVYLITDDDLDRVAAFGAVGAEPVSRALLERVAETQEAEVIGSVLVAPLIGARDQVAAGAMVLEATPLRPFDGPHRAFLELLVRTVGQALSSTMTHLREVDELRTVSDALQEAMLPDDRELPGVTVRYRPADAALAVGGDWYDVVDLLDGRRGLLVGDCVGHGLEAAARMGQLRSANRAVLLETGDPRTTLEALDRFAETLHGAECTTTFCGVIDETAGELRYSSAGHPPPLIARADGTTVWLDGATDPPLGVLRRPRPTASAPLRPGDTVVLYTDGLIERRGESLRAGLDRLAETVHALRAEVPHHRLADGLLAALLPNGARDDVALVVYHVDHAHLGSAGPALVQHGP